VTAKNVVDSSTGNNKAAKKMMPQSQSWNDVIVPDGNVKKIGAFSVIRVFALWWWHKHTAKEFLSWLNA
jgi:sporulation protein YlmC with PRC-barrel domain